jgi:transcriptional regulator with XRE-family HTH domain
MAKIGVALAKNIKFYRELRGWSRQELAIKMKVHANSIVKYESGAVGITLKMAEKFAAIFKIEETDLFAAELPRVIAAPEHGIDECARRVTELALNSDPSKRYTEPEPRPKRPQLKLAPPPLEPNQPVRQWTREEVHQAFLRLEEEIFGTDPKKNPA